MKDKDLWEHYTRSIKPAPKKPGKTIVLKVALDKSAARQAAEKNPLKLFVVGAEKKLTKDIVNPLERRREKSLRQGDIEIDAKLDLHGLTQIEAFDALTDFMERKTKAGKRCLLIITGKGRGGSGVLRRSLQGWLDQLPQAKRILALRSAAPQHGGDGAFYVLLRKKE